jgi:hypothetical protein
MKSHVELANEIMSLRLSAAKTYDYCRKSGKTKEETLSAVQPFQSTLQGLVRHSVRHDLPSCVMAVNQLHNMIKAHDEDIQFLMMKSIDLKKHVEMIENELMAHMKESNVDSLTSGDYSATMTTVDGKDTLTLR